MGYKDLPGVSETVDAATKNPLRRVVEAVQTLLGFRGDRQDKAVLWRDLIDGGLASLVPGDGTAGGTAPGTIVLPGGGGTGGGTTPDEPDLTPPPSPTGFTATAGFAQILVEVDPPTFTMGHGALRLNLYGAQKDRSDATMPTFGDAVLIDQITAPRTVATFSSNLFTRWHLWAKWETVDGVESTDPTGGTNGVIAQTGKIGNTDLGDLIIEANNLAAMDFGNLITNPDGVVQGSSGYGGADGVITAVHNPGAFPYWPNGDALQMTGRDTFFGNKFAVKPGDEFIFGIQAVPTGAGAATYAFLFGFTLHDFAGTVTDFVAVVTFPVGGGSVRSAVDASYKIPATSPTTGSPVAYARIWFSIQQAPNGAYAWYFNAPYVRRKPTKLAANTIVAGDGAIANLAILNALIANAAVDDAKIANLSAAKLTVGDGTVGGNLKSTTYTAGSVGWQLQPNGFAEFSNVTVRGVVYAAAGAIGGVTINTHDIRSNNFASGTTGFRIADDGSVECYNLTAAGNITANALNAATGTIGALTVSTTGNVKGGQTAYNTGIGFFLGYSGGFYKFSIGNPGGAFLTFDGTTLMFNQPTFDSFTASVTGGDLTVGGGIALLSGAQTYGSRTVAAAGGKTPYSYTWFLNLGSTGAGISDCWISAGTSLTATVTLAGTGDNVTNLARAICLVKDANGRTTVASFALSARHAAGSTGGGGGDAP